MAENTVVIRGIPQLPFVNVRSGPGTNQERLFQAEVGTLCAALEAAPDAENNALGGKVYQWLRLRFPDGQQGWVRDDLLELQPGDWRAFGYGMVSAATLASTLTRAEVAAPSEPERAAAPEAEPEQPSSVDRPTVELAAAALGNLFPAPMKDYTFIRGFTGEQPNHPGWDLAAPVGTAMFSGPVKGYVWRAHTCTKCTPEKPSTKDHGLEIGDTSVFFDEAWGWGNGHHVIVRYAHKDLPASTQKALAERGMDGWHIYAVYAHMNSFAVKQGQDIDANTQIGTCGNTGNSTGPHLHLEIRAFAQLTSGPLGYSQMKLLDPTILFSK